MNTVYVLSHTQVFVTPWTACQAPLSMEFSRQEYWSSHVLLQGIFPTKGLNPSILYLLHRYGDSLPLHHLGSPDTMYIVFLSQRRNTSDLTREQLRSFPHRKMSLYYHGQESNLPFLLEGCICFAALECLCFLPCGTALQTFLHKAVNALCSEVMQK